MSINGSVLTWEQPLTLTRGLVSLKAILLSSASIQLLVAPVNVITHETIFSFLCERWPSQSNEPSVSDSPTGMQYGNQIDESGFHPFHLKMQSYRHILKGVPSNVNSFVWMQKNKSSVFSGFEQRQHRDPSTVCLWRVKAMVTDILYPTTVYY